MKHYLAAAGALLLGTSTVAMAADAMKTPSQGGVEATKVTDAAAVQKSATAATLAASGWNDKAMADKMAWSDDMTGDKVTGTKLALASSSEGWSQDGTAKEAKFQTASADSWSSDLAAAKFASADSTGQTGVGGPDETAALDADMTPRAAAGNYPPCEPGPGDDRCIQLYERGVRAQLASWNQPTGGLADGSATTAMGGPYEPIQDHADAAATPVDSDAMAGMAANGDGSLDSAMGETTDLGMADASSTDLAAAHDNSAYQGVGGPVEAQDGYPPCEPGPGDDRCIQLYERGVTGSGN